MMAYLEHLQFQSTAYVNNSLVYHVTKSSDILNKTHGGQSEAALQTW